MAIAPEIQTFYMSAETLFPSIATSLPSGFPVGKTRVQFGVSDATVGFSYDNNLTWNMTTGNPAQADYGVLPRDIQGNSYISGAAVRQEEGDS